MSICFPGTIIEREQKTSRDFFSQMFCYTKGLMLAQVREITGLDTTTIQNWVNRGWVENPVDKRYSENHLAGIIIIYMLRDVMKMENILKLLDSLKDNGKMIIGKDELYHYICEVLDRISFDEILDMGKLNLVMNEVLVSNQRKWKGDFTRLKNVLHIILVYYASAIIKHKADQYFIQTMGEPVE